MATPKRGDDTPDIPIGESPGELAAPTPTPAEMAEMEDQPVQPLEEPALTDSANPASVDAPAIPTPPELAMPDVPVDVMASADAPGGEQGESLLAAPEPSPSNETVAMPPVSQPVVDEVAAPQQQTAEPLEDPQVPQDAQPAAIPEADEPLATPEPDEFTDVPDAAAGGDGGIQEDGPVPEMAPPRMDAPTPEQSDGGAGELIKMLQEMHDFLREIRDGIRELPENIATVIEQMGRL